MAELDKDRQIARAVALKAAVEIAAHPEIQIETILQNAEMLEGWLLEIIPAISLEPGDVIPGKETKSQGKYWCREHQTLWFKKGKMRNYAHPIGDTKKWCNMPEEIDTKKPEPAQPPVGQVPDEQADRKRYWEDIQKLTEWTKEEVVDWVCQTTGKARHQDVTTDELLGCWIRIKKQVAKK